MKKILALLAVFIALCGFRAPNGDIITEGDPVDKLIIDLGQPMARMPQDIVTIGYVTKILSEVWVYRIKDITYRFTIRGGVIYAIEWSR